jgi:DNA-binding transcriptional LysR family regulator
MLVKHLTYLTALARERHFGRAAESCGISQPALSAAIRQIEGELGVRVVERSRRFIGFTPEASWCWTVRNGWSTTSSRCARTSRS